MREAGLMERLLFVLMVLGVSLFMGIMIAVVAGCGKKKAHMGAVNAPVYSVIIQVVPSGPEDCDGPGEAILSGLDSNGDGVLQDVEVEAIEIRCDIVCEPDDDDSSSSDDDSSSSDDDSSDEESSDEV